MSEKVEHWRARLYPARLQAGVKMCSYPDEVILALIHVESGGDEYAHRDGSQYYGLLQMGRLAGLDAGIEDTSTLHGNGNAAILAFLRYQERYQSRHCYQPSRIAYLWKAGPGTLARANELTKSGMTQNEAFKQAASEKGVQNAMEYLRRFREAMEEYRG